MIDGHAHIISPDQALYPPAPPGGHIPPGTFDSPVDAERLLRDMDAAGVSRALLVQRGSVYGFDNSYVCDVAKQHSDRFSAVCSIDASAADGPEQVRRWHEAGAVGVRLMALGKRDDLDWLASGNAVGVWDEANRLRIPLCIHLFPWNRAAGLTEIIGLAGTYPDLPIVLDHLTNIAATEGPPGHGIDEALRTASRLPNISLKFTTIPLGAMLAAGVDAAPLIRQVVDLFGPERLFWGSDIGQSRGEYDEQVKLGRDAVQMLTPAIREQVLATNVARIYKLG